MAMIVKSALSAAVYQTGIRPMKGNAQIMDLQAWHFLESQSKIWMDLGTTCKVWRMRCEMQADSVSRASIGDHQDS
jgi:hypothetical protein